MAKPKKSKADTLRDSLESAQMNLSACKTWGAHSSAIAYWEMRIQHLVSMITKGTKP